MTIAQLPLFDRKETSAQWALRKWSEFALPAWQKVLKESIEQGDKKRETFAREILKMLEEK